MIVGLTQSQLLDLAIAALSILAAFVIGRWMIAVVVRGLVARVAGRTGTELDDVLVDALLPPLAWAFVAVVAELALARLDFLPESWTGPIDDAFFVLYVLIAFAALARTLGGLFKWYGREISMRTETDLDEQLLPILRRLSVLVVGLILLSMVLSRFDVQVGGLLATLGIGSLAIALAAQASLGDIFAGFVIMIDRPYRIRDRIEILDLDTWGDVVDIGLRSTKVRTRDNRMVVIPNSVMGKSLIVNHSFPNSYYRIDIHVGVEYGTDIEEARQVIIEAASQVEGLWEERPVEALFLEMADSALLFRIRVWIESYADARRMIDRVNSVVYPALRENGIGIPYPQRTVHHRIDELDEKKWSRLSAGRGD